MRGNPSYFKLGLFVIIAVALLVAGIIGLGAGAMFKKTIPIETVTTESVDGLDVGAQVRFRGVPIGTVAKIEPAIWRRSQGTVEEHLRLGNQIVLELAIDPRAFPTTDLEAIGAIIAKSVNAGLRARITSTGLTGPCYVEMVFVDPKDYPAMQLGWQPILPYVPSAPNAMSQIVASLESIATGVKRADVEKVVGHVDQLIVDTTKAVNDLQTPALRTNIQALLDEVRGSNGRLREVLNNPNIERTLKNISDATGSASELLGGEQVKAFATDLPKISARLRSTAERIDQLINSEQVSKAVDGLSSTTTNADRAMVEFHRSMSELSGLLATERRDIELAIVNLRRVLENTAALSGDLKDNPSRAVFGQPPPRSHPGD